MPLLTSQSYSHSLDVRPIWVSPVTDQDKFVSVRVKAKSDITVIQEAEIGYDGVLVLVVEVCEASFFLWTKDS